MQFSYWEKSIDLDKCQHLVVGMGLTGLQTAIRLKDKYPKQTVWCVDKHAWSIGASTRNAGFACFANISEVMSDLQKEPEDKVLQMIKSRYDGLNIIRKTLGGKHVDYQQLGCKEVFYSHQKNEMKKALDALQVLNTHLYDLLGLERVFTFGSGTSFPKSIGQITNQYEGQLHTGKLYQQLLNLAIEKGVECKGGFELISFDEGEKVKVVFKNNISIQTDNLWICTNAFSGELLNENVVPARGIIIVSEPQADLPFEGCFMNDNGYYYWRNLDNRVLLGGARNLDKANEQTPDLGINPEILKELESFMFKHILGKKAAITDTWSGIMAMGKKEEKTPLIKSIAPNIHFAVRLGGMGVALSAVAAKDLTEKYENC